MFRLHGRPRLPSAAGLLVILALLVACAQAPAPSPTSAKPAAEPAAAKPAAEPAPAKAPAAEPAKPAAPAAAPAPAAPAAAAPAPPKAAKPTGEFVIALPNLGPEKWDPSQTRSVLLTHSVGGPMYESLYLSYPPDGAIRPFLLESGKMAQDTMSWTFKLRDGIRFSNGDPMTAEDVKFSLDRYRSKESVSPMAAQFQKSIKDVVVVDRLTVRVDLNEPMILLDTMLASRMGNEGVMMPKKYIEKVGWEEFNRKPIGSGPYRLVEHKPGESVTYEAVENHWRTTAAYAKVRFVQVPEERSRIAMLKSGQADLTPISPDSKKELDQAGLKTLAIPSRALWQLNFYGAFGQYPSGPTSKVAVRKALDMAINKKEIVDAMYAGAGEVPAISPSVPGFSLGAPKGLKPSPYDPAEAKRLLQQAGYPNGFEITYYATPTPSCPQSRQLAEAIGSYWERIGVKIQIRPIEYTVLRPMFSGKEHASEIVGTVANHCTPSSPTALSDLNIYFWSKGIVKLTNVADAEVENAQRAKSADEMIRLTEAAYRKVYDDVSTIPILSGSELYGASKRAANLPVFNGTDILSMSLTQD